MELREWAIQILSAENLDAKLDSPTLLTDEQPGPALIWQEPARPLALKFRLHSRKDRLPPLHELGALDKRASCLHRFAAHELLAVEIMAFALLAFPEAPKHFRRSVAATLKEEQEHVRLYLTRMQELGLHFGDLPVFRHFWAYTRFMTTPLHYISLMNLTFEMANLDFAPMYRDIFTKYGDMGSAELMQRIVIDEVSHVASGYHWLNKLRPASLSDWETWVGSLPPKMELVRARARGHHFNPTYRREAGIPEPWIAQLSAL